MRSSVAAFVFILTAEAVLGADETVFKSNCFYEDPSDSCRSKTVDIGGRFYGCEEIIDFENEITKIEFVGKRDKESILVQDSESTSYLIDETEGKKMKSNLISTESCKLIVDQRKNVFKIESGKASVTRDIGYPTRDIVTESDFIPKELALDPKTGVLIILAVKMNNREETDQGSLFAINVNTLKKGPVVQAERISPRNVVFTGLAVYEGLDDLVVGIISDGKNKYLKLSAVPKTNKCFKRERRSLKEEILDILQETNSAESERISMLCSEYAQPAIPANSLDINQPATRISGKGRRGRPNTNGCDDKLERQREILLKIHTIIEPLITVKAKNSKVLKDFFYEVEEVLRE